MNFAVRATDLDTKNIEIDAEDIGNDGQSYILTYKNRKWMTEANIAQLLNRMGFVRAKFGHVVVKKLERPGELQIHLMPWRDLITDRWTCACLPGRAEDHRSCRRACGGRSSLFVRAQR